MKLLFMLCALSLELDSAGQNALVTPAFDQIESITFLVRHAWIFSILPDGSGGLQYGSTYGDFARIKSGTCDLKHVYKLIVPHLSNDSCKGNATAVFLHLKNQKPGTPTSALYLDDSQVIDPILIEARDESVPYSRKRFNELLEHSPLP